MTEPDWLPLEAELRDDADGARRDALIADLRERAADLKRRMDAGVAPAEFDGLARRHRGLTAAAQVVELVWRRHHPET
jgi:hypothetical protein